MGYWLFKTEPGDYSFSDLEKDGTTTWSGVRNNQALKHLRSVEKGDSVLIYHTGNEKAVIGVAEVVRGAQSGISHEKSADVDVKIIQRLKRPVTLAELRMEKEFEEFDLVRNSRLSVMPVNKQRWNLILKKGLS